jgi:hypothetical protein
LLDPPGVQLRDPGRHLFLRNLAVSFVSRVRLTPILVCRVHPVLDRLDQTMTERHCHRAPYQIFPLEVGHEGKQLLDVFNFTGVECQVPLWYLLGLMPRSLRERRSLIGDIKPLRPPPSGVVRQIHVDPFCLKT